MTAEPRLELSELACVARALNETLIAPRLVLEPMCAAHAGALFAPLQDERIYRWISGSAPRDLEAFRAQCKRGESRMAPDGQALLNWAIRRTSDGAYVGRLDALVDSWRVATNLGYVFFPDFWNHGYATECTRAVVEHFARHAVREIHAFVTSGNVSSERVLARAGFVRTRVLPNNDEIRGVLHDDVEYVHQSPAG